MKSTKHRKRKISFKHVVALFAVYFVLFMALTAMIDYYAWDNINPLIFVAVSFLGALWAAWTHAKSRQKTKADELARDLEEIL